jgi:Acetyltransferase (GNAT) domain
VTLKRAEWPFTLELLGVFAGLFNIKDFEERRCGIWTVREKGADAAVGFCGLRLVQDLGLVEVLYVLTESKWNHGYAFEAASTVIHHAFGLAGLDAVFGLDAGFFFAAGGDTPKTDSFNALAGVKRNRVRAGILMDSPVAGLRPMRAFSFRLRKMPKPAKRIDPSFLSSRTMSALSSSIVSFASFLLIPILSTKWPITCVCVILHLSLIIECRIKSYTG